MKVLMVSNAMPTTVANKLNQTGSASGGWVEAMALRLNELSEVQMAIAFKWDTTDRIKETINNIEYISFNYKCIEGKNDLSQEADRIIETLAPDIIHIEGTEFQHALELLLSGKRHGIKTIVSWQTVLNGVLSYEMGQLPIADMMLSFRLKEVYLAWLIYMRKQKLCKKRMKLEQAIIENTEYILGRTTWDHAYSYKMNPHAKYYSCPRVLKPRFYEMEWKLSEVRRHTIYFGSAYTITKGFHFMLYAMPQIIRDYPDVKLYVSGDDPFDKNDKRPFYRKGYASLIKKIVNDLKIKEHVIFTGRIPGDQVAEIMSKSHVYVMSSVIENSPNSFGEAMMIGMPCVVSYQGGVPDMAVDGEEALLFRNDDPALIAWKVKEIFDNDNLAVKLSRAARKRARINHDSIGNVNRMFEIYQDMVKQ